MDADAILRQLRKQRLLYVEIAQAQGDKPAQVLVARRPPESEWSKFVKAEGDKRLMVCSAELAASYVVDWKGFTSSDFLGPAGDSEPAPFAEPLWRAVAEDEPEWCRKVGERLIDEILARSEQRRADRGN